MTLGALYLPEPRAREAQVIVEFSHGADGRARRLRGGLMLDANRRRQAGNLFDLRLLHLTQKLPGVTRQRFDVAALALRVDRVECQRALARAARSAAYRHGLARHLRV